MDDETDEVSNLEPIATEKVERSKSSEKLLFDAAVASHSYYLSEGGVDGYKKLCRSASLTDERDRGGSGSGSNRGFLSRFLDFKKKKDMEVIVLGGGRYHRKGDEDIDGCDKEKKKKKKRGSWAPNAEKRWPIQGFY
ncbi:hypothetical protein ZOSMA_9G01480 [Zostera marina]|uniref:Uncharacterized protein n=1 Tax=Zostera marina TaxID=29655 RepID=A0A0K9NH15_ZOSMR|nr:hypothetical protein ZOSMA_9G01480 [Zostera marina]